MSVSHAHNDDTAIPGLLSLLAQVPDPRKLRGRRFGLVFVLAVAVVAVLAGAANFREIGDQADDLSQRLLERLGGRRHLLKHTIVAPSEKRIRTLVQQIDATVLDEIVGGWLRCLAEAGRLEPLLTALAIDGKHLRGTDGIVLFSAMLHDQRVIIAQRTVPEGTNEITQVKALLDPVDLDGVVVTGDRLPLWAVLPVFASVVALTVLSHFEVREPAGRANDTRTLASAVREHRQPGDAILIRHRGYRLVIAAYPDAYRGLRDVALDIPADQAADLQATEGDASTLPRRLLGALRVWYVDRNAGESPQKLEDSETKARLIRHSGLYEKAGTWPFKDGKLYLYVRR